MKRIEYTPLKTTTITDLPNDILYIIYNELYKEKDIVSCFSLYHSSKNIKQYIDMKLKEHSLPIIIYNTQLIYSLIKRHINNESLIKWILPYSSPPPYIDNQHNNQYIYYLNTIAYLYYKSAKYGNISVIHHLAIDKHLLVKRTEDGKLVADAYFIDERDNTEYTHFKGMVEIASKSNKPEVLEWISSNTNHFNFEKHSTYNYIIRYAIKKGSLDVLKWIYTKIGPSLLQCELSLLTIGNKKSFIVRLASNGYLHIFIWLKEKLNDFISNLIDINDTVYINDHFNTRIHDNIVFTACRFGHLQLLQWLYDEGYKISIDSYDMLSVTFRYNQINILKWLLSCNRVIISIFSFITFDDILRDILRFDNDNIDMFKLLFTYKHCPYTINELCRLSIIQSEVKRFKALVNEYDNYHIHKKHNENDEYNKQLSLHDNNHIYNETINLQSYYNHRTWFLYYTPLRDTDGLKWIINRFPDIKVRYDNKEYNHDHSFAYTTVFEQQLYGIETLKWLIDSNICHFDSYNDLYEFSLLHGNKDISEYLFNEKNATINNESL